MSNILVTNSAELAAALKTAQGGDTFLLQEGVYTPVGISGLNVGGTVTITSADVVHQATNTGLQMILDKAVTDTIAEHFPAIIYPFLEKNQLTIEAIDHLIFHPGGRKIVEVVQDVFGKMGKNIDETKDVLRKYGNMSSATVLYVLEQFMDKGCPEGTYGLMLSFGPGFSAQRVLLRW